jgi:hypothetical protein
MPQQQQQQLPQPVVLPPAGCTPSRRTGSSRRRQRRRHLQALPASDDGRGVAACHYLAMTWKSCSWRPAVPDDVPPVAGAEPAGPAAAASPLPGSDAASSPGSEGVGYSDIYWDELIEGQWLLEHAMTHCPGLIVMHTLMMLISSPWTRLTCSSPCPAM